MNTSKLHVLTVLSFQTAPITAETLTDIAENVGMNDTPQSLRSRLAELERKGLTYRVDRAGVSRHGRPCWRWQLTPQGKELIQEILDITTSSERN